MNRLKWTLIGLVAGLTVCLVMVKSLRSGRPAAAEVSPPHYIAFSLKEAEAILRRAPATGAPVRNLAGITRLVGAVYDRAHEDLLIVGQVTPGDRDEAAITLDDLCVALRARAAHQWPLVSIDKTPETPITGLQTVRFEGGPDIARSAYGLDLLHGDVDLKLLGFDGYEGLPSYLSLSAAQAESETQPRAIATRLWFVPARAAIARRDDVLAIQELEIGVQARVLNSVQDPAGERFARNLASRYEAISASRPRIRRLRALFALAGIAEGIRTLPGRPDVSYWLSDYRITPVAIDPTYKLIKRSVRLKSTGAPRTMTIDGGIEMKALISSLRDQDVTALRDLVLRTRTTTDALFWTVPLDGWKIPGAPATPGAAPNPTVALADDTPGSTFTKEFTNAFGRAVGASIGSIHAVPFAKTPFVTTPLNDGVAPVHFTAGGPTGHPGGVRFDPHPTPVGRGGAELRDRILHGRPGSGSATWDVPLPKEIDR